VLRERAQHPNTPFFMYLALPSPHLPWVPLPEYRGKSKVGDYGDYVVELDGMIGRVLDTLEQQSLADNTLVILTSDHGGYWAPIDIQRTGHRSNANWRGQKADVWEGGHRVPFIARWLDNVPAGAVCDDTASLTDLMATLAAMLHLKLPQDAAEDSFNMLPALLGEKHVPARKFLVSQSSAGMFTIREGDWKLALGLGSGGFSAPQHIDPQPGGMQGQLYNLHDDPGEIQNLWANCPNIVARLTAQMDEYKRAGRSRI
jgi:arylsulfatase A-like enzyme